MMCRVSGAAAASCLPKSATSGGAKGSDSASREDLARRCVLEADVLARGGETRGAASEKVSVGMGGRAGSTDGTGTRSRRWVAPGLPLPLPVPVSSSRIR